MFLLKAKKRRDSQGANLRKKDCNFARLLSFHLVRLQEKNKHVVVAGTHSHCTTIVKSMTSWKWINKYKDKICKDRLTLQLQAGTSGEKSQASPTAPWDEITYYQYAMFAIQIVSNCKWKLDYKPFSNFQDLTVFFLFLRWILTEQRKRDIPGLQPEDLAQVHESHDVTLHVKIRPQSDHSWCDWTEVLIPA